MVAVDAEIVVEHFGFNDVFTASGITHRCQSVGDEFRIKSHMMIDMKIRIRGLSRGGER